MKDSFERLDIVRKTLILSELTKDCRVINDILRYIHFYSYTDGKVVFFRYEKVKGVQWQKHVLPQVKNILQVELNRKVSLYDIRLTGFEYQEMYLSMYKGNDFPKYEWDNETKTFIKFKNYEERKNN